MRIGFVVNDIMTERAVYTTTRLAIAAIHAGHEVWTVGVADFAYDPDETISATGRRMSNDRYESAKDYIAELKSGGAREERISVRDLDVLMLRNDPAADADTRPWAQTPGILFGRLAVSRGVIVVNDPEALAGAMNKMYLQQFPQQVRPRTLITRHAEQVRAFLDEQDDDIIVKPLQGSGGHGVFLVRKKDHANLNQIFEAVSRDGYVIAQEYLSDAADGDVRVFVMNGQILERDSVCAAFRRVNESGDLRSNMHAGGSMAEAEITDEIREIVEVVRPRLVQDGMFLVGLDVVGSKLMEINVFSPGGLGSIEDLTGHDFAPDVIESLERKTAVRDSQAGVIANAVLATS